MLEIKKNDESEFRLLIVSGELDMDSATRLIDSIRGALKGISKLKIDLRDVAYVDSSGIAVLIQGYKLALKKSVEYILRDPSPQVMSVIELSQLEDFFSYDRTDCDALGEGA